VSERDIEVDTNTYRGEPDSYSRQESSFSQRNDPLSPDNTEISDSQSSNPLDTGGIPLSYILHPSHETNITTPTDQDLEDPSNTCEIPTETSNITHTCAALNITMETFRLL
jgi:hypothetical protein